MAKTAPFETHSQRYEAWFDNHEAAYLSELLAVRPFIPLHGRGLEVGVGSGRFAAPLGIKTGIEPCVEMSRIATQRGIEVIGAVAESLPFAINSFDYALVVTTICFVDSADSMLREIYRVLKPGGRVIIGFIDRESKMGQQYQAHQSENVFYKDATFYSSAEIEKLLLDAGFFINNWAQTLSHSLAETTAIEPVRSGRGQAAFVVVQAEKSMA